MSWKPDVCLYHFPCDDGFASAWIARKRWPDLVMAPTNYGQMFPHVDFRGKNVLIADFSYKPDAISELMMSFGARSIVMLDHHKTAQADLKDFAVEMCGGAKFTASDIDGAFRDMAQLDRPAVLARFDMERSGASLTWEFCFPDEPMPKLIRHIEDRDLWRMKLPNTRAISLFLRSYSYDFDVWTRVAEELGNDLSGGGLYVSELIREAAGIERFYDQKIAEMLPTATLKSIGKWKNIPVAHAPYAFASDLANEMLKTHPGAPFAAVVVDAYGGRTYSLRSEDSRQDVSEVARTFGGGGHRNAAGFRVPI